MLRCHTARGFTLTELVVSIGILALLMTMVGTVFQVTTKATGDAQAVMNVTRSVALLEETLRQDLAAVNPGRSMMIIQANRVNAYWTAEQAALDPVIAGSGGDPSKGYTHNPDPEREVLDPVAKKVFILDLPRADVLMFFTSRQQRSSTYPDIWSNSAQVVYGHAEIGELDKAGAWLPSSVLPNPFPFPPQGTTTPFPVPAEQWHLARRSVLLVDAVPGSFFDGTAPDIPGMDENADLPSSLDDGLYGGDLFSLATPPAPLRDGLVDIVSGAFNFEADVVKRTAASDPPTIANGEWIQRSRLDLLPPPQVASRLGHYFIPRCASFKVEWALDLRNFGQAFQAGQQAPPVGKGPPDSVIWLDPGRVNVTGGKDALGELTDLANLYADPVVSPPIGALKGRLTARFASAPGPQTPVWFANDVVNTNPQGSAGDPDRYFPVALRITVDVYDENSRLERPMRHVMVLPVGTQ